jgi:hypothetical protein
MFKKLALWIPQLRNLHEERNLYAQAVQQLEVEKGQLQFEIELLNKSDLKTELRNLHEERNLYAQAVQQLEVEKGQLQFEIELFEKSDLKTELDAISQRVSALSSAVSGLDEKISIQIAPKEENPAIRSENDFSLGDRGLFVVGHARSGTSILVDALNTSSEIYCLGEAFFYQNHAYPDFSKNFNDIHRRNGNPKYKATYCPDVGDVWSVLKHLAKRHKYVGEKLAFRLDRLGYDLNAFFDFSNKHFAQSHYVCVVRNPIDVISSNLAMFSNGQVDADTVGNAITSHLETYQIIVSLATTLPNVYLLRHESINQETFSTLATYLKCSLEHAGSLYFGDREKKYSNIENLLHQHPELDLVQTAHNQLLSIFCKSNLKISDGLIARHFLYHIANEIKRRTEVPSVDRFGIYSLADELKKFNQIILLTRGA